MIYDSGDGVEKDEEKAQQWYQRAEEQQKLDEEAEA
jgi:TPR repeat protein